MVASPVTGASPFSLYVHIPWCVRKCPYCDFNSHTSSAAADSAGRLPEQAYLSALLGDLDDEAALLPPGTEVVSVFFGGGTPSLMSDTFYRQLMAEIRQRLSLRADAEITLEANPGAVDQNHFAGYRAAGINRLSIGVQSFSDDSLKALGRIHGRHEALQAVSVARSSGFENINLDLMHGLPGQSVAMAMADLQQALVLAPEHLSWYQLTIEPNTAFYSAPPRLPEDDLLASIFEQGMDLLQRSGYRQYEVSAFARPGRQSVHNLNYWRFGDYLGIGAGAHGKVSTNDGIRRRWKTRMPADYLAASQKLAGDQLIPRDKLALEFLMNALRLREGFAVSDFEQRTGLSFAELEPIVTRLVERGLLQELPAQRNASSTCPPRHRVIATTERGFLFLNDVLAAFQ